MKEDKKTLVGAYCSYCGKYVKFLNPREREEAFCAISAKTKAQILNTKSKGKRKSK